VTSRYYDFHGVSIGIACDDGPLADALAARLRQFAVDSPRSTGLSFEIRFVAAPEAHVVARPDGAGRPVYEPPAGEVLYFEDEDVLYFDYDAAVRILCAPAEGSVRVSAVTSERASLWLLSRPLFTLPLVELLKRRGLYSVHAAGVCLGDRALLLAGPTASGKSTLALALVRAGFGFLADDMLFLGRRAGRLRALSFPDEIDIANEAAQWFPELASLAARPPRPGFSKHQIRAEELYGADFIDASDPVALVFAAVSPGERTVLEPIDGHGALLELASNVLLTESRASQAHLDALGELVQGSACYRLAAGRDFARIPTLLRELLA
jgi:hypothetical protein